MYNDVVKLVKETFTLDEYGNEISHESSREVFALIKSTGMREFYSAAQTDYKPECTVVLADYKDYDDEQKIIWNETSYRPIRTYRNGKQLEITLERRIGEYEEDESE